jgi:hypothetical protein
MTRYKSISDIEINEPKGTVEAVFCTMAPHVDLEGDSFARGAFSVTARWW